MYAFIPSSNVIKACFVNYPGCLSWNLSMNITELTTSWCAISRTLQMKALDHHGGCPLRMVINWSCNSLSTPALNCIISGQPFTMIWIYLHPTVCFFVFVLFPVLRTIFKTASWVLFLVASLAESRCTNWCLHSCCVPMRDVFNESPANRLDFDPLVPGCGGCVSIICCCGIGEEDDNEKKWEVLRNI